jgi:RNA polymerase sigma-70 factor (ECF subfamily)
MREPSDLYLRLRAGDEEAFRTLVGKHQASLIGVAQTFVGSRATAEDVVQDTWLAVIAGLEGFEGRASLKNWIFAILANKARSRAVRDSRIVAVGSFAEESEEGAPFVDASRFNSSGGWANPPALWDEVTPERIIAGKQIWSHVADAIETLPPAQRSVLILRDVEQMESTEVCEILDITQANQRVLLHRARAQIREFMERLLEN